MHNGCILYFHHVLSMHLLHPSLDLKEKVKYEPCCYQYKSYSPLLIFGLVGGILFILRNGTWQEITPFTLDVATCTVEFAVPSDPLIALLNTNITSTIPTTTTTPTTVQSSVTTATATTLQNTETTWTILAIVILIIVVVALYLYSRTRK